MSSMKELKRKTPEELKKLLTEEREELRDLRFKVSRDQTKNVRAIRAARREIARILTIMHHKA